MQILSVINYKGGVGKTTLTANIAANLATRGKKVLIIDLDPQTNLTLSLLHINEWKILDEEQKTIKHWYDNYLDHDLDSSLKDLIISPFTINNYLQGRNLTGRVDLICSHLELINVDMELSSRLGGNTDRTIRNNYLRVVSRLRYKINEIKHEYDYIIIDCPPNFNLVTQNGIIASDYYIIPAKPDYLSTIGIDALLRHIKTLTVKYNRYVEDYDGLEWDTIHPRNLGVVFTMVTYYDQKPIGTQREYIMQVMKSNIPTLRNVVRESKTLFSTAPEQRIPVVLNEATGAQELIRKQLENLVNEILQVTDLKFK